MKTGVRDRLIKATIMIVTAILFAAQVQADDQGRVDAKVAGKIHAQFKDMEFTIDTGFMGKPIYRITLTGAQPETYAVSTITLIVPEHLKPGSYKVIDANSNKSPMISDAKIPVDSDPAKVLIGVSYGCDCEHHPVMDTYAWGPAKGAFVVTSHDATRISGHFQFTQTTPDGKDKVEVSGKLIHLEL